MNVSVTVQLGINGRARQLNPLFLDVGSIGAASSWSGSYHVLSMGRHYDEYVVAGRTINLPPIQGFPPAHPYERLAGKIRAAGVTGNIGEAIAAIFARRVLRANVGDITHVRPRRPFRRRKAPDYLMRLVAVMPGPFGAVLPTGLSFRWPEWWPVESKARNSPSGSDAGRRDALQQLAAYWSLLADSQPFLVGFGIIVSFTYQPPREVRANLILPTDQRQLVEVLKETQDPDVSRLKDFLNGC